MASMSLSTAQTLRNVLARAGQAQDTNRLSHHLFKTVKAVLGNDRTAQECGLNTRGCRRMPVCEFRPAYEAAITLPSFTRATLRANARRAHFRRAGLTCLDFLKGLGMAV